MAKNRQLISALYGKYEGKPILVIGGGPSVSEDLERVPVDYPVCVISANGHGYKQTKFKTDYIVNVDYTYNVGRIMMERHLAQYSCPKINRWSWADYRLPEWKFAGDSGFTAILVANMLGGWPVLVTGLDRFAPNAGRKYFWEERKAGRDAYRGTQWRPEHLKNQLDTLRKALPGACVRPLSGPLIGLFPAWGGPESDLPPYSPAQNRRPAATGFIVQAQRKCYLHPADAIQPGVVMPMTPGEAERLTVTGAVKKL
jgi:hypothetical protein